MMDGLELDFEWDAVKSASNVLKHGLGFELAASVMFDALALTVFDDAHSQYEERWFTLGVSSNGQLLAVSHTFVTTSAGSMKRCCDKLQAMQAAQGFSFDDGIEDQRVQAHSEQDAHKVKMMNAQVTKPTDDDDMPAEIDFSKGVRGKFYNANAVFQLPIYLDAPIAAYLTERARAKGVEYSHLVNELLRKDIELIEAAR